jgi:large subunit ribosomal protein L9
MAKDYRLLLTENVENLGIVGDIVKVKRGFARNFLLPMQLAEKPSAHKVEALKERRAEAEKQLALLRKDRESLLARMHDITLTLVRSCNDQGILYGSVSQRDIADGLLENGYDVGIRSVRLPQPLRRLGSYHVPIQFERDLRTEITVVIEADQPLEQRQEMEIDEEGEIVEQKPKREKRERKPKKDAEAEAETAEV